MPKKILINPSIFFMYFWRFESVLDIFAQKLSEEGAEKVEIKIVRGSSDLQSDPEAAMNILFEVPPIFCPSDRKWSEDQCQPNEVIVWLDGEDWGNIAEQVARIVAHTAGGTDPYYRWYTLWRDAIREGR